MVASYQHLVLADLQRKFTENSAYCTYSKASVIRMYIVFVKLYASLCVCLSVGQSTVAGSCNLICPPVLLGLTAIQRTNHAPYGRK